MRPLPPFFKLNMNDIKKGKSKVLDLRQPRKKVAEPKAKTPKKVNKRRSLVGKEKAEDLIASISPEEMQLAASRAREPERDIVWPRVNPNAPLVDYENRILYYLNKSGKKVVVTEEQAFWIHHKMAEFHGDQNGNMTPPRLLNKKVINHNTGEVTYSKRHA